MRTLRISNRAKNTPSSPIRKLSPYAQASQAQGVIVHRLNIGQPDVPTPKEFFEGIALFKEPVVAYDLSQGSSKLRTSWISYFKRVLEIDLTQDSMLITTGASEALTFSFMTLCDPGDEVIIFDPTYANFIGFAAIAGVSLVPVRCELSENFALPSADTIEQHFSNRTRAILLCNPNNPTGTIYSEKEVKQLLDLCEENNIFLVVDETYREIVFDNLKPFSVLHIARGNPRVIVVDSLSKRFSICGARLGSIITANSDVYGAILNIAQARLAAPTIEQFAAAHMIDLLGKEHLNQTVKIYQLRRDTLFLNLKAIKGVQLESPSGAFYTVVRLPVADAELFCRYLLEEFRLNNETVFLAPARGFFLEQGRGAQEVRIAFVLNNPELERCCELLESALRQWNFASKSSFN
jgi:aspartate aminotransferase